MIKGHCECGRVAFEADCEITDFSHCHCSQCRRLHGAAFATYAEVQRDKFRYAGGKEFTKVYASSANNQRVFCGNCGSNILVQSTSFPDVVYLAMGTIDGSPSHPDGYHIFVGSKAPWHDIADSAPQFDTVPDN